MFQLLIATLFLFTPGEGEKLLSAVPKDAKMVFSIQSAEELRSSFEDLAWNRFFEEPEVQAWIEGVCGWLDIEEVLDFPEDEEGEEDLSPKRLIESISGSMAGFLSMTAMEEWGAGVLVEPGDKRDEFDEFISGFMDYLVEEEGMTESTLSYGEIELHLYEEADDEGSEVTILADTGEVVMLVVRNEKEKGVEMVHSIIDTLAGEGEAESILDSERFLKVREKSGGPGDLEIFIDLQTLVRLALEMEGEGDEAILSVFSLEDLKAVYLTGALGKQERARVTFHLGIQGEGLIRRLVDCLGGEPPLDFKKHTPADAVGFGAMFFDLNSLIQKSLAAWEEIDKESYGEFRMMYDQMVKVQFDIDPEKEIFALMNGQVGTFNVEVPPEEMAFMKAFIPVAEEELPGLSIGYIYLIGLTDSKQFKANLDKILRTFGLHVSKKAEDFQGYTLESFQFPMGNFRLYWAYTEDGWALSPFPTAIRAYLRLVAQDDLPTIEENKDFMGCMKKWPGASAVSMGKVEMAVENFFAWIPSSLAMMNVDAEAGDFAGEMPDLEPISRELIEKYFKGIMGSAIMVDDEGVSVIMTVE